MSLDKKHPLYQEDLNNILAIPDVDFLRGKSFLITGATGLIGVQMIDALMQLGGVKVYATGRSKAKAESRLGEYYSHPDFCFIEQDVTQPFEGVQNVDYIIPLASNTHPLAYSKYPIETILTNVKGVEYALELASACNATVLYPSTVEIYGNARGEDVFTEDYTGILDLSTSRSCYTESKRLSEAMCQSYIAQRGLDVKIARLSRIFGPTMLESDTKASSQFLTKALNGEDIVLKSTGDQFFSYTYVADAVAAMLYILLHGEVGKAYNISNDSCNMRLKEFARLCAEYNGKDVVFDLPSSTEKQGYSIAVHAILDNQKLRGIGFQPLYSKENAIRRTLEILK